MLVTSCISTSFTDNLQMFRRYSAIIRAHCWRPHMKTVEGLTSVVQLYMTKLIKNALQSTDVYRTFFHLAQYLLMKPHVLLCHGERSINCWLNKSAFNSIRTRTIMLFKFFGYPESVLARIRQNIQPDFRSNYTGNFKNKNYIV